MYFVLFTLYFLLCTNIKNMKNILYIFLLGIFFASCEPADMEIPELGEKSTGDFTITASSVDGTYNFDFAATGQNAFMYNWDFNNGFTNQGASTSSYFPFKNTYTVACTISGKAGSIKVEKTITIDVTDPKISQRPIIKELTATGAGQTWVYATDYPGTAFLDWMTFPAYCFMTDALDDDSGIAWTKPWWNPYGDEATPDATGEMAFDLNGGYNFTGVDGNQGSFILDAEKMTIQFKDANILDWDEGNCDPDVTATGIYQIISITDNELILWQNQTTKNPDDFDYGWTWIFKRKGYTYPAGK